MVDKTIYQGAQLGVQLSPNCGDKGAYVEEIVSNSAADNSILKVKDLLLFINDVEIDYPAHFKRILLKHEPLQEVTITFERKSKIYTTQVILGANTSKIIQEEVCCDTVNFKENISVYPNPVSKNLNISFVKTLQGKYDFEIFNLNGIRFFSDNNTNLTNQLTKTINVEKLDEGVYVLKIKQGDQVYSSLFAVKKQ